MFRERVKKMAGHSTLQLIKLTNNLFRSRIDYQLKDRIITKTQAEIMLFIREKNKKNIEVNQVDIQDNFHLTNPTVTGILNRLEEKCFIERRKSEKSARCNRIVVTDKGLQELTFGHAVIESLEKEFLSCLTESEQKTLYDLLLKLSESNTMRG